MSVGDAAVAGDGVAVAFQPVIFEPFKWGPTHWLVEKWSEDACEWVRRKFCLDAAAQISSELLRKYVGEAEEVDEDFGNILLNAGIQRMEDILIGAVTTNLYTNANARLGVGDSTTAEAATQTDLQAATNKTYVAMNATFPSRSAQTLSFQSDFTSGSANYAWQEFITDNGVTSTAALNRKVTSLGTKATGTWTLTETIAIS